jgi:phosphoadenosine phosphosulfate reductase
MDFSSALSSSSATRDAQRALPDLDGLFNSLHNMETAGADGREVLSQAIHGPLRERIAVVSSFGAESALLLSVVAEIDPSIPVIFLETGKHFPETLAYRDELTATLGLTDVRDIVPPAQSLRENDPDGELWYYDPDACCALRKVAPLAHALAPFDAWISGRKRFQAATRAALPLVERDGTRLKLNPLADWDAERVRRELARRKLPQHPLVAQGYPSIGCAVCTRSVAAGEDSRAGRWSGSGKVECGIHSTAVPA